MKTIYKGRGLYMLFISALLQGFKIMRYFGLLKFYHTIPQLHITTHPAKASVTFRRWEAMRACLPDRKMSVLDIGCNSGFFSIHLAERGNFVTAVDNHIYALFVFLAKERLRLGNIAPCNYLLTPDNIATMPCYDCILLLAVFHHWCDHYGSEQALDMLAATYSKAGAILFFETGQPDSSDTEKIRRYQKHMPDMGNDAEAWMHGYFKKLGCRKVETISRAENNRCLLAVYK